MASSASTSAIANFFSSIFSPNSKPPQLPTIAAATTPSSSHRHFDSLPTLSSSITREGSGKNQPLLPLASSSCPDNDVMSVVCPSLAYSNTLFFSSTYNIEVIVDDNEPEEKLLNRFRREVMRAGVIQECRRRRFHENKQDEKKRKTREAAKRNRRRRPQFRTDFEDKQEASKKKKDQDQDQDNWDLPEGDLPY